jgi:hypothetical protein
LTEAVRFMQKAREQLARQLLPLGSWRKFPMLLKHRDEFQILSPSRAINPSSTNFNLADLVREK